MPQPAIGLLVAALLGAMLLRPGRAARIWLLVAFLGLVLGLIAGSTPRLVGDAREYVVMARNLAQFERPSATEEDVAELSALFPGVSGGDLAMPQLRGPDGRQDFPHFWFYPLLAAPFVAAGSAFGASVLAGFTALNVLLLLGTAAVLGRRVAPAVSLIVIAGPILWWVDKAHSEVFTFSMIVVALTQLASRPWWSIVALAAAGAQNPPIAGAMLLAIGFALYTRGWREPRIWWATVVGAILAAMHPVYFYSRLRVWTGLYEGVDRHWPSWRELFTAVFDPNLGMAVHDPFLFVAIAIALVEAGTRPERRGDSLEVVDEDGVARPLSLGLPERITLVLIALLFLVSFTQTTNVNSGGTPDPSRYGLWLVPFGVPILSRVSPYARWLEIVAAGSVVWCVMAFAPSLPDQYLRPTSVAAEVWRRWPGLDNPMAEVFAERVAGHEPARPPVATAGCEKVLLWGDGSGAAWPPPCAPVPLPGFCGAKDALCYANRTSDSYRFVAARSAPAWRTQIAREVRRGWTDGMLGITQETEPAVPVAIWHEDGWSYQERLSVPAPDVISREWRWMGDRAGIGVMASASVNARLKITARALGKPRRLRVSIAQSEIATLLVMPDRGEHETPRFTLPAGTATIALESIDGTGSPGSGDSRRLSVAVYLLELVIERR